jgi:Zn-dependent peptidase ImmA (M78 family)
MSLKLDRMAIEEVGLNPQRLAEAIHIQIGNVDGPVPVYEIAQALDIHEIREESLKNLEAALLTTPERGYGSILLNSNSNSRRRRFSIGHELLHFLNPQHEQTSANGFLCSRKDMLASSAGTRDRHLRQEGEANEFAIELLTPRKLLKPFLRGAADLTKIVELAARFDISKEAAARRYIGCHDENLAVVFCRAGVLAYADRGADFPRLSLRNRQICYREAACEGTISDFEEVAPEHWLAGATRGIILSAQTLWQAAGHSITLLQAALPEEDEQGDHDDANELFDRLNGR